MFTSATGRLQPLWSFLLAMAFSVAAFLGCSFVAALSSGEHVLRFEAIFRPLLSVALFGLYFWLLTVADEVEENRVAALGFPFAPGWRMQFAGGCLLGLLLTVLAVVPLAIWADISFDLRLSSRGILRVVVVILVLIFGALAEEMMFRGYPFQRLEEVIGSVGAIAVFSVLFALVHLSNPGASPLGLANTVLIGIVLAMAYLRTRALWLSWGIHFGWNLSLGLLFGLPVSGLRLFNVLIHTSVKGPRWLTGGSYGVEASAPGVFAVAVGLLILWKWPLARLGQSLRFPPSQPEHLDGVAGIQN